MDTLKDLMYNLSQPMTWWVIGCLAAMIGLALGFIYLWCLCSGEPFHVRGVLWPVKEKKVKRW